LGGVPTLCSPPIPSRPRPNPPRPNPPVPAALVIVTPSPTPLPTYLSTVGSTPTVSKEVTAPPTMEDRSDV